MRLFNKKISIVVFILTILVLFLAVLIIQNYTIYVAPSMGIPPQVAPISFWLIVASLIVPKVRKAIRNNLSKVLQWWIGLNEKVHNKEMDYLNIKDTPLSKTTNLESRSLTSIYLNKNVYTKSRNSVKHALGIEFILKTIVVLIFWLPCIFTTVKLIQTGVWAEDPFFAVVLICLDIGILLYYFASIFSSYWLHRR